MAPDRPQDCENPLLVKSKMANGAQIGLI